jgi:hypothetical protein
VPNAAHFGIRFVVALVLGVLIDSIGLLAAQSPNSASANSQPNIEERKLTIEQAKLDWEKQLDQARFDWTRKLDQAKFDSDKEKDSRNFNLEFLKAALTAMSIGIPLLLGLVAYRGQIKTQMLNESLQFKLKAAEIAMNARDANQVQAKAAILKALFENELKTFDPSTFEPKDYPFSRSVEARESLVTLLASNPASRKEIIEAWGIVFPWDGNAQWNDLPPEQRKKYRWFDQLRKSGDVNQNRVVPSGNPV